MCFRILLIRKSDVSRREYLPSEELSVFRHFPVNLETKKRIARVFSGNCVEQINEYNALGQRIINEGIEP